MNWSIVTEEDLRGTVPGEVLSAVRALAVPGQADPVAGALAEAVRVTRAAVAAGNALEHDFATVPGSLRGLTARLAGFALTERLQIELTADQRVTRAADTARLERLRAGRERVEAADRPLQTGGGVVTVAPGDQGNGRGELRGI